ncbi:unnamed protein product [Amaranthus hypochondriacus]
MSSDDEQPSSSYRRYQGPVPGFRRGMTLENQPPPVNQEPNRVQEDDYNYEWEEEIVAGSSASEQRRGYRRDFRDSRRYYEEDEFRDLKTRILQGYVVS